MERWLWPDVRAARHKADTAASPPTILSDRSQRRSSKRFIRSAIIASQWPQRPQLPHAGRKQPRNDPRFRPTRLMPFPAPTFQCRSEVYGPMLAGSNARRRLMRSHVGNCPLMTPKYNRPGKAGPRPARLSGCGRACPWDTNSGVPELANSLQSRRNDPEHCQLVWILTETERFQP